MNRALSSQYNSSNTLKERFAYLVYFYWQDSTRKWKDFNTDILEMKCLNDIVSMKITKVEMVPTGS